MRARLDKLLNSWVSKKLTVFLIATLMAITGAISGHEWVNISLMYIGTQGAIDAVVRLRGIQQD